MKSTIENINRRLYNPPVIQLIKLDSTISLQLESEPPIGPSEGASLAPEYMKTDSFKSYLG